MYHGICKKKNLVIVCAGDNSLHMKFPFPNNNFDLMVIYYGNDESKKDLYSKHCDFFIQSKGYKFELARNILLKQLQIKLNFQFSDYSYIWFPDDDLEFVDSNGIFAMFEVAEKIQADIFQPALINEGIDKFWIATKHVENTFVRRTNVVELMAWGFKGKIFTDCFFPCLQVFDYMKAGWGIESVLTKFIESLIQKPPRVFVLDCVQINHAKPLDDSSKLHERGKFECHYTLQHVCNRMRTVKAYKSLQEVLNDNFPTFENYDYSESYYNHVFAKYIKANTLI